MVELKESLDRLARMPKTYTGHLTFPAPEKIFLYDDTLRDGEQMPGVAFSPAQKLKLAELLAGMGIDVMDVAFPISSDSDRQALSDILRAQQDGEAARQPGRIGDVPGRARRHRLRARVRGAGGREARRRVGAHPVDAVGPAPEVQARPGAAADEKGARSRRGWTRRSSSTATPTSA